MRNAIACRRDRSVEPETDEKKGTDMLVYCVADIHGKDRLLARVVEQAERLKPDALIVAGDLARMRKAAYVMERLRELSLPVLFVKGNHDPADLDEQAHKPPYAYSLHMRSVQLNGVRFTGVGGAVSIPFRGRVALREKRLLGQVKSLVQPGDVFVAHLPPHRSLDRVMGRFYSGSRGLRDVVISTKPSVFVCGHIHEDSGITRLGATLVINCSVFRRGSGAALELREGAEPKAQLLV